MITDIIVPVAVVGLASSILTELLKLFPSLNETDERKRFVAFIVALVISFIYILATSTEVSIFAFIVGALSATFIIFKAIVQPIEGVVLGVYNRIVNRQE